MFHTFDPHIFTYWSFWPLTIENLTYLMGKVFLPWLGICHLCILQNYFWKRRLRPNCLTKVSACITIIILLSKLVRYSIADLSSMWGCSHNPGFCTKRGGREAPTAKWHYWVESAGCLYSGAYMHQFNCMFYIHPSYSIAYLYPS